MFWKPYWLKKITPCLQWSCLNVWVNKELSMINNIKLFLRSKVYYFVEIRIARGMRVGSSWRGGNSIWLCVGCEELFRSRRTSSDQGSAMDVFLANESTLGVFFVFRILWWLKIYVIHHIWSADKVMKWIWSCNIRGWKRPLSTRSLTFKMTRLNALSIELIKPTAESRPLRVRNIHDGGNVLKWLRIMK